MIIKGDARATYYKLKNSKISYVNEPPQGLMYFATDYRREFVQAHRTHHIDPDTLDEIMEAFLYTLEHLPVSILELSYTTIQRLFVLSQLSVAEKTGFQLEETVTLLVKDGEPALSGYYDLLHPTAFKAERFHWSMYLRNMDTSIEIPDPHPAFKMFYTEKAKEKLTGEWEGVSLRKRKYAMSLGFYLQSYLSGYVGDQLQANIQHKALLEQFGIRKMIKGPKIGDLAYVHAQSRTVRPTTNALAFMPWLFEIDTSKFASPQRHAVCAAIQKVWLERQDGETAWDVGCWTADMISKFGAEAFQAGIAPSDEEAAATFQECANPDCGRQTICKHMHWVRTLLFNGQVCTPCKEFFVSTGRSVAQKDAALVSGVVSDVKNALQAFAEKAQMPRSMKYLRRIMQMSLGDERARLVRRDIDSVEDGQPARRMPHVDELFRPLKPLFHHNVTDETQSFWTDSYMTSACGGPNGDPHKIVSGDSIFPIAWDGQVGIHVRGNIAVTKRYINFLKGTWPPIVLQLFHLLDQATDPEMIEELVRRLDNLVLIRRQIPWSVRERDNLSGDDLEEFVSDFQDQCKTGIPTEEACARRGLNGIWKVLVFTESAPQSETPELEAVKTFIRDFEDSRRRLGRIPRLGDDVPYPFRGGPTPKVWTWPIIYAYFAQKLKILKLKCNRYFITTITVPQLIVVTFLLLWLPKDHPSVQYRLLDLPCSFYTQTPLSMSIGKALHGRQMRSGLPADGPLLFSALDFVDINILPEPWLANAAKSNWDMSVNAMRQDFRSNLKRDNPPFWNRELASMNGSINTTYIFNAPARFVVPDDGVDDEDAEEDIVEGGTVRGRSSSTSSMSSSSSSASDDRPKAPTAGLRVRGRNLINIGQTCYMSTVLQALLKQPFIQSFLSDEKNFVYRSATGNSDVLMVPAGVSLTSEQHKELVKSTLKKYQRFIDGLFSVFERLSESGPAMDAGITKSILRRAQKIDERWENKPNESAQLYEFILNILVRASDMSEPTESHVAHSTRLAAQNSALIITGRQLPPLVQDAAAFRRAYEDDGNLSAIVDVTTPQIVQEILCDEQGCKTISRTFLSEPLIYLDFPSGVQASDHFTLAQLLDLWKLDKVSARCRKTKAHVGASEAHRRFSKLSRLICFAFRRSVGPDMPKLLNHIELPDVLDLQNYASAAGLPSNLLYGEELEIDATKYRLRFVNHYRHIGQHYIGYSDQSQTEELQWIRFDDTEPYPRRMNPIEGNILGEVVHFAIYERMETPLRHPSVAGKIINLGQSTSGEGAANGGATGNGATVQDDSAMDMSVGGVGDDEATAPGKNIHPRPPTSQSTFRPAAQRPRLDDEATSMTGQEAVGAAEIAQQLAELQDQREELQREREQLEKDRREMDEKQRQLEKDRREFQQAQRREAAQAQQPPSSTPIPSSSSDGAKRVVTEEIAHLERWLNRIGEDWQEQYDMKEAKINEQQAHIASSRTQLANAEDEIAARQQQIVQLRQSITEAEESILGIARWWHDWAITKQGECDAVGHQLEQMKKTLMELEDEEDEEL